VTNRSIELKKIKRQKSKGKRQKVGTDLFQSQQGSEMISIFLPFDFCLLPFDFP
jgi:hypothetical protein